MKLAADHKVLFCHLALLCLGFLCLCSGIEGAASLCYKFKVDKTESGPWSNEVQGQLNTQTLFLYKDGNCRYIGDQGNRVNATRICEKQVDTLKDGLDIFKGLLLYLCEETKTIRGSTALQADMCCQYVRDGHFRGFLHIKLNGNDMFHVDMSTGNWTVVDPSDKKIIQMWKSNRNVADFLRRTSQGDCKHWLDELLLLWKEHLEPTETTKNVDKPQPTSDNIWVIILCIAVLIILIILGLCFYVSRYRSPEKIDPQSSSPPHLKDSLTLLKMCSSKEANGFPTASQNSLLLTSEQTGGNPGD